MRVKSNLSEILIIENEYLSELFVFNIFVLAPFGFIVLILLLIRPFFAIKKYNVSSKINDRALEIILIK